MHSGEPWRDGAGMSLVDRCLVWATGLEQHHRQAWPENFGAWALRYHFIDGAQTAELVEGPLPDVLLLGPIGAKVVRSPGWLLTPAEN